MENKKSRSHPVAGLMAVLAGICLLTHQAESRPFGARPVTHEVIDDLPSEWLQQEAPFVFSEEDENIPQFVNVPPPGIGEDLLKTPGYGYDLVMNVNKADSNRNPNGQKMTVQVLNTGLQTPQSTWTWPVSTGAETRAATRLVLPNGNRYYSNRHTRPGFFHVQRVHSQAGYQSRTWDVVLPWAIFYDIDGGYAIHGAVGRGAQRLGRRDSGGCVRLRMDQAAQLNRLIRNRVGRGWVLRLDQNTGQPTYDFEGTPDVIYTWKALVVVREN